jgi:hypothetical protein
MYDYIPATVVGLILILVIVFATGRTRCQPTSISDPPVAVAPSAFETLDVSEAIVSESAQEESLFELAPVTFTAQADSYALAPNPVTYELAPQPAS